MHRRRLRHSSLPPPPPSSRRVHDIVTLHTLPRLATLTAVIFYQTTFWICPFPPFRFRSWTWMLFWFPPSPSNRPFVSQLMDIWFLVLPFSFHCTRQHVFHPREQVFSERISCCMSFFPNRLAHSNLALINPHLLQPLYPSIPYFHVQITFRISPLPSYSQLQPSVAISPTLLPLRSSSPPNPPSSFLLTGPNTRPSLSHLRQKPTPSAVPCRC